MVIRLKKTDRVTFLLALMLNWNAITGLIDSMSKLPGLAFLSFFSSITILFSLLFLALTVLFTISNKANMNTYLLLLFGWIVLFAISYLLNPQLLAIAPRAFIYYANNVFCLAILLQSVVDLEALIDLLKKYIPFAVAYAVLQWIVGINDELYSMAFSYGTMVPMLLCLLLVVREKDGRFWHLACFIIFLISNFKFGSRGSFVCCALALILNFCFSEKKKQAKYLIALILAVLIVSMNWEHILEMMARYFSGSRNYIILSQRIAFYGSGREEMYRMVLNEFIQNPFAIRGLYSDRLLLSGFLYDLDGLWGSYTHNMIFELLYQFGIWSVPVIIALIAFMIKIFLNGRNADQSEQYMILIAYSFAVGQLMISSSYLITPSFGLLIGMLLWSNRHHKESAVR